MSDTLYSQEEYDRQFEKARAEAYAQAYDEARKQAHIDAKLDAASEGRAAGIAKGREEGAEAYRARVREIITSDAAKGREATAWHLALETSMSAESAIGALATVKTQSAIAARAASTFAMVDPTTLQ